jgi:uncharacterized RDD family membrane protein YckC
MNQTVLPDNPYAAPAAAIVEQTPREAVLAGRGTRLGAVMIDGLIFGLSIVPGLVLLTMVGGTDSSLEFMRQQDRAASIGFGLVALLFFGVAVWNCVLLHRRGQTIAKKMLGIRVVRKDGSRCGLARIFFARYLPVTLLGMVPFVGGLVSLVDALLIFRDDRRCLHDEIADTIVVVA